MSYTDTEKMCLARAWAEWVHDTPEMYGGTRDRARAAADVVASLPEVIVDGDKLREVIETTPSDPGSLALVPLIEELRALLSTHCPAHECAADVLYSVSYGGAVHTAWRVDNDDTPWIVSVGRGTTWAADKAVRVLGPVVPADGVVDRPVVGDDADDLTDLREASADDDGARVTLEQVAEADPAYIYTDRDGEEWGHLAGRWISGDTHAKRAAKRRLGFGHDSLPEEYGPYARIEQVAEADPAYIYRDRDGDEWEHIDGRWVHAGTHDERVTLRKADFGIASLPAKFGPYTRTEKDTND